MDKLTEELFKNIDESADKLHLVVKTNLTKALVEDECRCAELALTVAMLASGNYYLGNMRSELTFTDIACLEASSFTRVENRIIEDGDVLDEIRKNPAKWHERIMQLEAETSMMETQIENIRSIYVDNYNHKVWFSKGSYGAIHKAFHMNDEEKKHFNSLIDCLLNLLDS